MGGWVGAWVGGWRRGRRKVGGGGLAQGLEEDMFSSAGGQALASDC